MEKKGVLVFVSLFFVLFSVIVSAKDLGVSPFGINIDYIVGDPQPGDVSLTFVNDDYTTFEVEVSKDGDAADFFSLSKTSMSFINHSASSLDVSFDIPEDTAEGLYTGNILYDDEEIPVYIFVDNEEIIEEPTEGCRIISTYSEHIYSKKKGTEPTTEDFYFKISNDCLEGIDITDIRLDGGIDTEEGKQPLRLSGGIPKGSYDAGDSLIVTLELDISELSPQTYKEKLLIAGLTGDESIRKEISFTVNVFGSSSTFSDISSIAPPIYDPIPDTLVVNQTYAVIVRDINPNLEVFFKPNEYIYCEPADSSGDGVIIYKFHPVKEGETTFQIYATYKGGVVGTPKVQDVKIRSEAGSSLGSIIKIYFLKDVNSLKDGDEVSFLVSNVASNETDPSQGIILPEDFFTAHLNGNSLEGNRFTVIAGGEYILVVSASGYKTVEERFSIQHKTISISISPAEPKLNDTVTVNTEANATINLNGAVLEGTSFVVGLGTYNIDVSQEGFQSNTLNFTVTLPVSLINFPLVTEEDGTPIIISTDEELHFEFNQPTYWSMMHSTEEMVEAGTPPKLVAEGEEQSFVFIPEEEGDYFLQITGGQMWVSHIEGGFDLFSYWWVKAIVVAIILGLTAYASREWIAEKLKFQGKTKDPKIGYEFKP